MLFDIEKDVLSRIHGKFFSKIFALLKFFLYLILMSEILVSWIGATDLRTPEEERKEGLGPIAQAVSTRSFQEIVLLCDYPASKTKTYLQWIRGKTNATISLVKVRLASPTNFGEIYQAAIKVLSDLQQKNGTNVNFTFHLSPGTPAMAAVWIILAKTCFPATLIESSKKHGVHTVSIPFDISAEFLPDLLKKPDQTLERLAAGLPSEAPEFDDIVHRSDSMRRSVLKARKVSVRSIPVLIEGESGTGKELIAKAIHNASPRNNKPFIAVNCGAVPAELMESEFFGYEKGAFTGAQSAKAGHFEAADGGTLFLDEIGELPKNMQVKFLRALQENEIMRIGSTQARKIDVRIIAATNKNLIEEVASGTLREDLFFRLAVGFIRLPPLRERSGDIGLLIEHFMEKINKESRNEPGFSQKRISVPARNLLLQHDWPGNIRELQNTLTRAAVWSANEEIGEEDIRDAIFQLPVSSVENDGILDRPLREGFSLPGIIKKVAVHYLERGLSETHGNKTKTAEILGLPSYQTLTNWLKRYGIE